MGGLLAKGERQRSRRCLVAIAAIVVVTVAPAIGAMEKDTVEDFCRPRLETPGLLGANCSDPAARCKYVSIPVYIFFQSAFGFSLDFVFLITNPLTLMLTSQGRCSLRLPSLLCPPFTAYR